jgi:hypothetical protein
MSFKPAQDIRLTPEQLVERWQGAVSLATLATWRSRGGGPSFIKVGRQPLYPLADVEAYEAKHRRE